MQTSEPMYTALHASLRFAAAVLITTIITGCGLPGSTKPQEDTSPPPGSDTQVLWFSGLDYVQLIPQDGVATPSNEHPANISPVEIESMFAALRVRKAVNSKESLTSVDYEVVPVFNRKELAKISNLISDALGRAEPRQDVAFSVSSSRKGWFAKRTLSTTGRVFVHDGRLNIIFRELHEAYEYIYKATTYPTGGYISDFDKRRNPLLPGSRTQLTPHKWSLSPVSGVIIDPVRKQRDDWVSLDPNLGSVVSSGSTRPDVEHSPEDVDVENEGQAFDRDGSPLPPQTRPATSNSAGTTKAGIKQRLIDLKDLRDSGLVPESLYLEEVKKTLEDLHK